MRDVSQQQLGLGLCITSTAMRCAGNPPNLSPPMSAGSSSTSESPTIEHEKLLANTEQAEMDRMYDQNNGLRLDAPKVPESPYGWKAM